MAQHIYSLRLNWIGNQGTGTSGYQTYSRNHLIEIPGKEPLKGSSDPHFRGDSTRYNPEELLLASIASCHMLWFLHLCADAGIVVTGYVDQPTATMQVTADGGGCFTAATLYPSVTLANPKDGALLDAIHHRAHELCFIANSVNFPIACESVYL